MESMTSQKLIKEHHDMIGTGSLRYPEGHFVHLPTVHIFNLARNCNGYFLIAVIFKNDDF